ncbi:hypothetical protein MTO96_051353 [Rhipicephalus appendiculatus]
MTATRSLWPHSASGRRDQSSYLFDGLRVPKFVRHGPTLVRCYLYRKQFDVCFTCSRVGHRSDVCPTPDSGEEPSTHQWTTSAHPSASSAEETTPPETSRAGSGFKYPMWHGLAKGNATGQNRQRGHPRRRQPWRQAYSRTPQATHTLEAARGPDAARYPGRKAAPSREQLQCT